MITFYEAQEKVKRAKANEENAFKAEVEEYVNTNISPKIEAKAIEGETSIRLVLQDLDEKKFDAVATYVRIVGGYTTYQDCYERVLTIFW